MSHNPVVTFFPVGNGDTTLIELNDGSPSCILVDINIRADSGDEHATQKFDVRSDLLSRLPKDYNGRPYLDLFVLTHADKDHVSGFSEIFHIGDPNEYLEPTKGEQPKILIGEIWCSSRFRNIDSDSNTLCEDAKAFNSEARRRETLLLNGNSRSSDQGNLLRVIGDAGVDRPGFPADHESHVGTIIDSFGGHRQPSFKALVIGPVAKQDNESDYYKNKNRTGVILQLSFARENSFGWSAHPVSHVNQLLMGDDNEVETWKIVADQSTLKPYPTALAYDILLAPHHGSWHTLSEDSATECSNPQPDPIAKENLSHAKQRTSYIVISSNSDDEEEEPSKTKGRQLSKQVYQQFVLSKNILCTGDSMSNGHLVPISFELTPLGPRKMPPAPVPPASIASQHSFGQAYAHG